MARAERAGRWRSLLVTATFTGMRSSELRGLRWQDVDLDAKLIHVHQRADGGPRCRRRAQDDDDFDADSDDDET